MFGWFKKKKKEKTQTHKKPEELGLEGLLQRASGEELLKLISWGEWDEIEWQAWMNRKKREQRGIGDVSEFRRARGRKRKQNSC